MPPSAEIQTTRADTGSALQSPSIRQSKQRPSGYQAFCFFPKKLSRVEIGKNNSIFPNSKFLNSASKLPGKHLQFCFLPNKKEHKLNNSFSTHPHPVQYLFNQESQVNPSFQNTIIIIFLYTTLIPQLDMKIPNPVKLHEFLIKVEQVNQTWNEKIRKGYSNSFLLNNTEADFTQSYSVIPIWKRSTGGMNRFEEGLFMTSVK